MGKENITHSGEDIRLISEKMLDYLSQAFLAIGIGATSRLRFILPLLFNLRMWFFTGITAYRS